MNETVPEPLLLDVSQRIARSMGLDFPLNRRADLLRGLRSAARELGFERLEAFLRCLAASPLTGHQVQLLAHHLTVGETYFFREPVVFDILERIILPEVKKQCGAAGQSMRIWSAGCCSGEEAYSLAISVRRSLGAASGQAAILATDINDQFLAKAKAAAFGEWSFRGVPRAVRKEYFKKEGRQKWRVSPLIRDMVEFESHNLAEGAPAGMANPGTPASLILCRNVLLYFTPEKAREIIEKLRGCLMEGGWLVLGANDIPSGGVPGLETVRLEGLTFFRKPAAGGKRAENPEPREIAVPEMPVLEMPLPLAGNWEQGWEALSRPAGEDRENETSGREQALRLYETGDYEQAARVLAASVRASGGDIEAMALLARALANQNKFEEALAWSERVLDKEKVHPAMHYLRGTIFEAKGDPVEAAAAFQRALYARPELLAAHFALGNIARKQQKDALAQKHYRNAMELALKHGPEEIVEFSGGMTAAALAGMIGGLRNGSK